MKSSRFIVAQSNNQFEVHAENDHDAIVRDTEEEGVEAAVRMLRNLGYTGEHKTERQSNGDVFVWLHSSHGQSPN
jgi:hypothetical protein